MSEFGKKREDHAVAEAEATLRLIASQPAPEGLAGRVHQRLHREQQVLVREPERRGFWRLWLPAHRVQFAGAAALAGVIAVSAMSMRHRVHVAPQGLVPVPVQGGTFGTSSAHAQPSTLTPIPVPAPAKKKKPSAAHTGRHLQKSPAPAETNAASTAP